MAFLTEAAVKTRAAQVTYRFTKSADGVLREKRASANQTFDVFLSHSSQEPAEILLGVTALLEDQGLSVYIDSYSDPQLSPDSVTQETAAVLRHRMRSSKALLYVHSQYSKASRWMPWELGYFDGLKGSVGIVPVLRDGSDRFKGEEYLGLYPYVDLAPMKDESVDRLWINKSASEYARLDNWAKGAGPIRAH